MMILLVAVGFNKKRRVLPIYSVEPKQSLRFANLKATKIQGSVPSATRQSTKWAATIWKNSNWKENRSKLNAEIPFELEGITNEQLKRMSSPRLAVLLYSILLAVQSHYCWS